MNSKLPTLNFGQDISANKELSWGRHWFRRGSQSLKVHAEEETILVKNVSNVIVANDDNYALAA